MKKTMKACYKSILAAVLCGALLCVTGFPLAVQTTRKPAAQVRSVELESQTYDSSVVISEFENASMNNENGVVSFSGTKKLDFSSLSDVDLIALDETFGENFNDVRYDLQYDIETATVQLSITVHTECGEEITDTVNGIAFMTETGKSDAYLMIDGETVLLSDLCGEGVLDNVGLFSWIKKAVLSIAKKIVLCIQEPIKVMTVLMAPCATILGKTLELTALPFHYKNSDANLKSNQQQELPPSIDGYISGQNDYDEFTKWKYGFDTVDNNGCGAIATYNAMVFAGKIKRDIDGDDKKTAQYRAQCFANLIHSYELNAGTLIGGKLGTNPSAIPQMLKKHGVKVASYSSLSGYVGFEYACQHLQSNQMAILCYWWFDDSTGVKIGAHNVCITKSGNEYSYINDDLTGDISWVLHGSKITNGYIMGWVITK